MKPIVFEQHCQDCHPLQLSEGLGGLGVAPHGPVDEVYGFLRRAKLDQLNRDVESKESLPSQETSARGAVKSRRPRQALLSQQQEDELHGEADRVVFGREAKRLCASCHFMRVRGDTWEVLAENSDLVGVVSAVTTKQRLVMPNRWMPHANFDHRSHRAVACGECHAAENSVETTDILLPSIDTCRKCHGGAGEMATGRVGGECVLCHTYHGEAKAHGGVTLDVLFNLSASHLQGSPGHE
jgi:hypothetical protein